MNRLSQLDVFVNFEENTVRVSCIWRDLCQSWLQAPLNDYSAVGAAMVTMLNHERNCTMRPDQG